jgi:hypothetical protein
VSVCYHKMMAKEEKWRKERKKQRQRKEQERKDRESASSKLDNLYVPNCYFILFNYLLFYSFYFPFFQTLNKSMLRGVKGGGVEQLSVRACARFNPQNKMMNQSINHAWKCQLISNMLLRQSGQKLFWYVCQNRNY